MSGLASGRIAVMEPDECYRLLNAHHVGRLAVVVGDQPLVFPVNYAMAGRQVVFRSDPGTKLHGTAEHRVAFEIDGVDTAYHEGWSVLVVGTAHEEHEPSRLHTFEQLPFMPWAAGRKAHWMYISGVSVTGRRLTHLEAD